MNLSLHKVNIINTNDLILIYISDCALTYNSLLMILSAVTPQPSILNSNRSELC